MGSEKNKIKVLVTGGGGFVGMALVRRLVKLGYEVYSFSEKMYDEHKKLGVKGIQGSVVQAAEIEKACQGMEVVFHVAAKVGIWGDYRDFYAVNVTGTKNVISACQKNGVEKLIFTSSASVVFDGSDLKNADEKMEYPIHPVSSYTATKAAAEQVVINANSPGLNTISLRPHLIWGPGDTQLIPKILQRAESGSLRRIGKKNALIDTVYIDNLIDAQLLALKKIEKRNVNGNAFFITNDEPVRVWDFINSIAEAFGAPAIRMSIPKTLAWIIAWCLEKIHGLFRIKKEPFITRFLIQELSSDHWFNLSKAKHNLGYKPRVNTREGFSRLKNSEKPGSDD